MVTRDHLGRIIKPRGAGLLPAPKCTDPREYERAYHELEATIQSWILRKKFGLELPPPPARPRITSWDLEELQSTFRQLDTLKGLPQPVDPSRPSLPK